MYMYMYMKVCTRHNFDIHVHTLVLHTHTGHAVLTSESGEVRGEPSSIFSSMTVTEGGLGFGLGFGLMMGGALRLERNSFIRAMRASEVSSLSSSCVCVCACVCASVCVAEGADMNAMSMSV